MAPLASVLAETEPPGIGPGGDRYQGSARVVMEPRESAQAVMAPPALAPVVTGFPGIGAGGDGGG